MDSVEFFTLSNNRYTNKVHDNKNVQFLNSSLLCNRLCILKGKVDLAKLKKFNKLAKHGRIFKIQVAICIKIKISMGVNFFDEISKLGHFK